MNDDFFEGLVELMHSIATLSEKSWPERIVILSVTGAIPVNKLNPMWLAATTKGVKNEP